MVDDANTTGPNGIGQKALIDRVTLLGRRLKAAGLPIGLTAVQDAVAALGLVDISRLDDVRLALEANLVIRRGDREVFDRLFDEIFFSGALAGPKGDTSCSPPIDTVDRSVVSVDLATADDQPTEGRYTPYSAVEVLRTRDLAGLDAIEQEEAIRLIRQVVRPMALRRSRRHKPVKGGRGDKIHFPRTMRRSLSSGGEMVELIRKARRPRRRQLVLLADVSGSMDPYLPFVIALAVNLGRLGRDVHVFTFATRLTDVTDLLWSRPGREMMNRLSRRVPDWSGGTRIGQVFGEFNRRVAPRLGPGKTIVMVYSDGWDRGTPEIMADETARLASFAHRIVWLNPLMKSPSYRPTCRGMAAALPFIDRLLPVHTVELLEEVVKGAL